MGDAVNEEDCRGSALVASPKRDVAFFEGDKDFEPPNGIEFESHEAAYAFYQEYGKSMGFTTSIKNSRRSKKTKEFIDAKFACSRYGVTPESDSGSSRRPSVKKTDCKACMHVKKKQDGKWIIHEFIKDHNHELLPALAYHFRIHRNVKLADKNNMDILHAVSERTRKMFVEMSRQSGGCQNIGSLASDMNYQVDRGQYLALDEGDAQVMLEYFKHVQKKSSNFFYAIDLNEEQRLRNLFWADSKSIHDHLSFNDAVSFDTSYMKSNDKLPFAPFVGVNHHSQPILLGCALVADETKQTFVWLLKTWLRAMRGQAPKVIVTDQNKALKEAIEEVFPNARHCFSLWHILEKIPENLSFVIKQYKNFLPKFNNCIFKSWTDEEFDMRWWEMVTIFELHDDLWFHSLYEDRKKWVPTFMGDVFLAGLSTPQRSESMNYFFDKYINKKITLKEFVKLYGLILQHRYDEESVADFDTLHKQPALKSPSPWEKQMSTIYTHAIFKKFQVEVLGVAGCQSRIEAGDETVAKFIVQDYEKDEEFLVTWNESSLEVSCFCRLFEYKGFLCRHALSVLQRCGCSSVPAQYIIKRWTKDAKVREPITDSSRRLQTRVQRYNDLCKRAIELSEEGSLSEESYNVALRTLIDSLKNCVLANNANNNGAETGNSGCSLREAEENQGSLALKPSKKRNITRKRKVQQEQNPVLVDAQDSLQQMDNLTSDAMTLNGYYGTQQNVQGLQVQLNLMEPPHDGYYVNQHSMQGLGPLNSMAPSHDGFFGTQQSIHGMGGGQLEYRPTTTFGYSLQDEPDPPHFHSNNTRNT